MRPRIWTSRNNRSPERLIKALVVLLFILLSQVNQLAALAQTHEVPAGPELNNASQQPSGEARNTQGTSQNRYADAENDYKVIQQAAGYNQQNINNGVRKILSQDRWMVSPDGSVAIPNDQSPTTLIFQAAEQGLGNDLQDDADNLLSGNLGSINETYRGLHQFFKDDIVTTLFENMGQLFGKWMTEFINGWIADTVQFLARFLRVFVLNPNVAVNGLDGNPDDGLSKYIRQGADVMYGIAVDLLLLLFILAIWKYWADAAWKGAGNLMGAVGRLIFTAGLMLAWPTLYAFEVQITNEMIKAIYFNTSDQVLMLDSAMASMVKGGLIAAGAGATSVFAPILGNFAIPGVGSMVGSVFYFASIIIFTILGGILIAEILYILILKAIQTALLTAQYMFAPIFLVFFATPDTESIASGFVRSFVETSLWTFVWVGLLKIMVLIMFSDYNPWGKILISIGVLQMMIQVPAFLARAQISPMSEFITAGLLTGGALKLLGGMSNMLTNGIQKAGNWFFDERYADAGLKMSTNQGMTGLPGSPGNPEKLKALTDASRFERSKNSNIGVTTPTDFAPPIKGATGSGVPGTPGGPGGPGAGMPTAGGVTPPLKPASGIGTGVGTGTGAGAGTGVPGSAAGAAAGTGLPGAAGTPLAAGVGAGTGAGAGKGIAASALAAGAMAAGVGGAGALGGIAAGAAGAGALGGIAAGAAGAGGAGGAAGATAMPAAAALAGTPGMIGPGLPKGPSDPADKYQLPVSDTNYWEERGLKFVPMRKIVGAITAVEGTGLRKDQEATSIMGSSMHGTERVNIRKGASDTEAAHAIMAAAYANDASTDHNARDAARMAAIEMGANKPKGLGENMWANWLGNTGGSWNRTAAAKQRFGQAMFGAAVQGAQAYVGGEKGNAYTAYLRQRYGDWTQDDDTMATFILTEHDASESPWNRTIGPATGSLVSSGIPIGFDTRGAMQNAAIMAMHPSRQKVAVPAVLQYLWPGVREEYKDADPSVQKLALGERAKSLSAGEVAYATAVYGISGGADLNPVNAGYVTTLAAESGSDIGTSYAGLINTAGPVAAGMGRLRRGVNVAQITSLDDLSRSIEPAAGETHLQAYGSVLETASGALRQGAVAGIPIKAVLNPSVAGPAFEFIGSDVMNIESDQAQHKLQVVSSVLRTGRPFNTQTLNAVAAFEGPIDKLGSQEVTVLGRLQPNWDRSAHGPLSPTVVNVAANLGYGNQGATLDSAALSEIHNVARHYEAGIVSNYGQAQIIRQMESGKIQVTPMTVRLAVDHANDRGGTIDAPVLDQTVRIASVLRSPGNACSVHDIWADAVSASPHGGTINPGDLAVQLQRSGALTDYQMMDPGTVQLLVQQCGSGTHHPFTAQAIGVTTRILGSAAVAQHPEYIELTADYLDNGARSHQIQQSDLIAMAQLHAAMKDNNTYPPPPAGTSIPLSPQVVTYMQRSNEYSASGPSLAQSLWDEIVKRFAK